MTLAGSAAVGNAEILAGIVVNQVLEPGRPLIYNLGLAHVFDMRTSIAVTGGPENALLAQASAAMGRFYGLPSCSWMCTEAMLPHIPEEYIEIIEDKEPQPSQRPGAKPTQNGPGQRPAYPGRADRSNLSRSR